MHILLPYLTMFFSSLSKYFIEKYSKIDDFAINNFSVRSNIALVLRELNRKFIVNDLNQ